MLKVHCYCSVLQLHLVLWDWRSWWQQPYFTQTSKKHGEETQPVSTFRKWMKREYRIQLFGLFFLFLLAHLWGQTVLCIALLKPLSLSDNSPPPLSRLFLGTDSSAASSPVRETPRSPPTGSSGESMDSVSVSSSDSSSPSDSEGLTTPTHTSDIHQNKVGHSKTTTFFLQTRHTAKLESSTFLITKLKSRSAAQTATFLKSFNSNSI